MKITALIVLALLMTSFECTRDEEDPIVNQDVLFAHIYENHAWGERLHGWFIDNSGYVRGFSLERNPNMKWYPLYEGGFIAADTLMLNYLQTDTTFLKIPIDDLLYYYELIGEAARGTLTEKEARGADMGQLSNYCLLFFPGENQYKFILLESTGDWRVHNIAPAAQKINSWLDEIDDRISIAGIP